MVRRVMFLVIEMSSSVQEILLAQWSVLVRIFKLAYHETKAARSTVFLRKLSEFRTESQLSDLLYFLFESERDPLLRASIQRCSVMDYSDHAG